MSPRTIQLAGLGASTPVGRNAWSSAAAVRAGISGFAEHPFMVDTAGQPIRVAAAPWLPIDLAGAARLQALLLPAVAQALAPLSQHGDALHAGVPVYLGLPMPCPGHAGDTGPRLQDALAAAPNLRLGTVAVFEHGHAAGLSALRCAMAQLERAEVDACVVAGVDSHLAPDTLEWLEANDQLHGAGVLNNAWGFIPGEGAGALLLTRSDSDIGRRLPCLGRILGVGSATEPHRIKTESVCLGEGLTQALRGALQALPTGALVSDLYCDMNGEPYRADEYGFASLRVGASFTTASAFHAPADCWGDLAAAGAPLHLMLGAIAAAKGYARGTLCLVWASAESGERAAALMGAAPP